MAENSGITWTDHTINLWWGCSKVHTGCKNCYAEHLSDNRMQKGLWGENAGRNRIKSAFPDLDKYQKRAEKEGIKYRIFCGSMMDIFEDSKDLLNPITGFITTDDLRQDLFNRITLGEYNNLTFLFLTKRPENIREYIPANWSINGAPRNVWFGTSISEQETADKYVPSLVKTGQYRLFLSVEPQVGPIDKIDLTSISWVIQGGESGDKKRPFDVKWAYSMRDTCEQRGVAYFFKQIDKVQAIPEDLIIEQFPF